VELSDYIRILRKNWIVIVAITLVGIGAAAAWSLTRTPGYQATSQVFVSTQSGGTVSELQQGSTFSQARVQTYVNLVSTPIVLNPVISYLEVDDLSADDLATQVSASSPLNTTIIEIAVTDADPVRAADIANAVGASLTSTVAELETLPGTTESPIKLTRVKDALAPFTPVSPNVPLNLALGALVGLALGIGVAVLRTVLDTRIRSTRDVEQATDRPIIGTIPFDPKAKERPVILHADPQNVRSEAFRALRTNLQFLDMDGGKTFVVTSSVPSEGKSTTSVNHAIALADAGKRVVSAGATTRHQLESAIEALDTVDARVAGVVLTMVPTKGPDAYGYGYGYVMACTAVCPRRLPPSRNADAVRQDRVRLAWAGATRSRIRSPQALHTRRLGWPDALVHDRQLGSALS
jgi:capsular polysaccharide biosynthesis protein